MILSTYSTIRDNKVILAFVKEGMVWKFYTNITNIRTIDRKTNSRGIVSDKNNQNSSNRIDLTSLSRISFSLENNKNNSLITLFIGFVTKN